tara:strand:+ start:78 stop:473 length:396 start_codon:yes stop_codon:yes gene_type:complete
MKHVNLLILLVLAAPFGWGDDLVLYCVRTEHAYISPQTAYTYNKFSDGYKHVQITLKITDGKVDLKSPNNWLNGKQFIVLDTQWDYILAQEINNGFEDFIRITGEDNYEYSYVQNIAGNSLAIDAGTCTKY